MRTCSLGRFAEGDKGEALEGLLWDAAAEKGYKTIKQHSENK